MDTVTGRFSVVDVKSGFSEDESLALFSSYTGVPVDYLPAEAKDIHLECKVGVVLLVERGLLISCYLLS